MKIAVCDDEELFASQIKDNLEMYYNSMDVLIETISSGEELLKLAFSKKYDLVFLDIEMKGKNGITVARELHEINPKLPIIFLTSHTELAMEGYEVEAFRFLAKPLNAERFKEALMTYEKIYRKNCKIMFTQDGVQQYLDVSDIQYIKAENVYLYICTLDKTYLVRKKMKELLEELPKEWFVQIHRSYIINLLYVTSFDGNQVGIDSKKSLPVSKSRRQLFQDAMMRYMRNGD